MAESQPPKANLGQKLKERWNVKTGWDVVVILLVFACTGFSILYLKRLIYGLIGLDVQSAAWLRGLVALFVVLPLYQVVLLLSLIHILVFQIGLYFILPIGMAQDRLVMQYHLH